MTISSHERRRRKARNAVAHLPHTWFSTNEMTPDLRHEGWRQTVGVCLESSLSHHDESGNFSATLEGYLLDDIVFSRPQAARQKFDRTSLRIAQDGVDHYMIEMFFEGFMEMQIHGRSIRNSPGQIVGFDLGDILDSVNTDFDLLCLFVPRVRLAPLLVNPDSLHGLIPDLNGGPGFLLASYLQTLYRALPTLSAADAPTAANALLQLIAAAFNRASGEQSVDTSVRHHDTFLRAQLYIRANLASRSLSADGIALKMGISRTALYQLFEELGGVASYVRELRLRKCLSEITAIRHATTQIAEISYRWGFDDPSVFSRAFRQRFGCAPNEARALAYARVSRDHAGLVSSGADRDVGDRTYEEWIAGLRINEPA
jgi:AraC-like DNA-binding protein